MDPSLEHGRDSTVGGGPSSVASQTSAAFIDVEAVAALFGDCSTRHVYRLDHAAKMPVTVRHGSLVRWNRTLIDAGLAGDCKPVRNVSAKGGIH